MPDESIAFLREGYAFISNRTRRAGTDLFETRLLFWPTICMTGAEAAQLFYDPEKFQRAHAAPIRLKLTLFGVGGVQGLDGDAHRARKAMFMSLMSRQHMGGLLEGVRREWRTALQRWQRRDRIVLFDEVEELLCRAVCSWSGVPLPDSEVSRRTRDLSEMVDGAGAVGWRHWRARAARLRSERWCAGLVRRVRAGELRVPEESALAVISAHRDPRGRRMSTRVAAVELLNVLRPVVAVARYVVFAAHALHQHPQSRAALAEDDDAALGRFVHEVRRLYPFFPLVAARVRSPFTWRGMRFPRGRRVLLDLYGTNRDPAVWEDADAFRPERFRDWDGSAFNFIPQGGGDHFAGHRCAGEWLTVGMMKVSVALLVREMRYDVPPQDLRISLSRMPAQPASRFVIARVQALSAVTDTRSAESFEPAPI